MPRRFIAQLGERESIDEVFLASEKQLRPNRNGHLYLQLRLADRTGSVNAMMWNANEQVYASFDNGDFVHVEGTVQVYNGALQVIVNEIGIAEPGKVSEGDFFVLSDGDVTKLQARLSQILRGIRNLPLRNLAEAFLLDEEFMRKFSRAPAGVKNHHAYPGGLLEHVLNLLEMSLLVGPRYPKLDLDLLLMGAFLHDVGKIDELLYERELAYSDEGQLIGHLVMGVSILEAKIREAEKLSGEALPDDLTMQIKHMIVSHHGDYAFGSPKLPMTLEAVLLHYLDNIDAKLHGFQLLMAADANVDSNWTSYQANLGRKLYKGSK